MIRNPLGARGVAAEAAIARLCLESLPAMELFERAAGPLRRVVPYSAGCWKTVDPRTLLYTGFGIEDGLTGTLTAARWRFIDNELLEPDYGKYHELARRPTPVSTLHRDTHGEPGRSSRYRNIHRSLGFGAELRAVFRAGGESWGHVALIRGENQPDFSDQEVAFIARVGAHLAREREVAGLLTRGASNEEIAQALWISRHTVKDHVKAVYAKLKVAGRAELSAKLFQEHIAPRLDSKTIREFGPAGLAR